MLVSVSDLLGWKPLMIIGIFAKIYPCYLCTVIPSLKVDSVDEIAVIWSTCERLNASLNRLISCGFSPACLQGQELKYTHMFAYKLLLLFGMNAESTEEPWFLDSSEIRQSLHMSEPLPASSNPSATAGGAHHCLHQRSGFQHYLSGTSHCLTISTAHTWLWIWFAMYPLSTISMFWT